MTAVEAERVLKTLFRHFKKKEPIIDFENLNINKDGLLVVLETSTVPVLDENSRLTGYRGIDRDITKRKYAEEALR